ncbi:hypothetical protein MYX07_04835 [Patescibacteria group bacterium AH-259-L07]|nr:hypothetical protein [Patescibacteria group bacterium AH-259-L07]
MELQQFGFNVVTVGFLGTVFFTFVQAWALWKQKKAIWDNKSGQSVNIIWFSYTAASFVRMLIYGVAIQSIALGINGLLLSLLYIPILVGLWKFKRFNKSERFLGICFLITIPIMIAIPAKDWFFFLLAFIGVIPLILQAWEIWKSKNSGVVEIKLLTTFWFATLFWVIYSFAIGDWVLKIITPLFLATFTLTIVLWFKYRDKKTDPKINTIKLSP